jgi:eukaryotic-like serine/threonine-protein kinase
MTDLSTGADPFLGKTVLGRYRIVRPIGRGGMGIIYLARHEGAARFVRPVVVKRAAPDLLAKEPELVNVMGREARIMSHLHDPSIVSVIDFAQEDGAYFLVLDYVHGFHLGQWHRFMKRTDRRFPTDLAIHIACKVLDALHYAHTARGADERPLGIVHRDVSPGNVLIDVEGHVRLADFGIARMHSDHTEATTDRAVIKGKFAYMAPELLARAEPSPATDVYAAGVVLHELLVGQNELRSESIELTVARILNHVPTPVRSVRADAPEGIDRVIAKALVKRPGERYASAGEFADSLRALPGVDRGDALDVKLAAAVGGDFRDPKMSEILGVTDLATLDRAWRAVSVPDIALEPDSLAQRYSGADTVVAPPAAVAPARRGPSARILAIGACVVGAAALAAGAGLALRRPAPGPSAPAPVIIVNGQVSGDGVSLASGATGPATTPLRVGPVPAADAPPPPAGPSPRPATPPGPAPRGDGADALTRAFSRQQGHVAKCFADHATDVAGTPEIAIHFGIDASGHVTSAQVLPPAVATTALGACLSAVAQATSFGPQPHDVSFRIPIVARRAQ